MTNEELLKRKKLEFLEEFKKNHVEYGLPVADVVNGDVVFCKDEKTLLAYKSEVTFFTKKIVISIVTMSLFLLSMILCKFFELSNEITVYSSFGVLFLGIVIWLYVHFKEEKLPEVKYGDVIVFDGPHRNS